MDKRRTGTSNNNNDDDNNNNNNNNNNDLSVPLLNNNSNQQNSPSSRSGGVSNMSPIKVNDHFEDLMEEHILFLDEDNSNTKYISFNRNRTGSQQTVEFLNDDSNNNNHENEEEDIVGFIEQRQQQFLESERSGTNLLAFRPKRNGLNYLNFVTYITQLILSVLIGFWGCDGYFYTTWAHLEHYKTLISPEYYTYQWLYYVVLMLLGIFNGLQFFFPARYSTRSIVQESIGFLYFYSGLFQIGFIVFWNFDLVLLSFFSIGGLTLSLFLIVVRTTQEQNVTANRTTTTGGSRNNRMHQNDTSSGRGRSNTATSLLFNNNNNTETTIITNEVDTSDYFNDIEIDLLEDNIMNLHDDTADDNMFVTDQLPRTSSGGGGSGGNTITTGTSHNVRFREFEEYWIFRFPFLMYFGWSMLMFLLHFTMLFHSSHHSRYIFPHHKHHPTIHNDTNSSIINNTMNHQHYDHYYQEEENSNSNNNNNQQSYDQNYFIGFYNNGNHHHDGNNNHDHYYPAKFSLFHAASSLASINNASSLSEDIDYYYHNTINRNNSSSNSNTNSSNSSNSDNNNDDDFYDYGENDDDINNFTLTLAADIVSLSLSLIVACLFIIFSGPPFGKTDFCIPLVVLWFYVGIACRLLHPSDALVDIYGYIVIDAVLNTVWFFSATLLCMIVPRLVVYVCHNFCTIRLVSVSI